jgi:hypothetical protein
MVPIETSLTSRGGAVVGNENRFTEKSSTTPGAGTYSYRVLPSPGVIFTKEKRLKQKISTSPSPLSYRP